MMWLVIWVFRLFGRARNTMPGWSTIVIEDTADIINSFVGLFVGRLNFFVAI